MLFEEFQDGRHGDQLEYPNETTLAVLNFFVAPMPPIQVSGQSNVWFGRRCLLKNFKRPSWISERNDFSNSESLCRSDASHQVSAQSDMVWGWDGVGVGAGEMSFEEFQDSHLGYRNGTILEILNLYVTLMSSIKFGLNPTYGLGGDVDWRISRWPPWRLSWISERNNFSNSDSACCHNASH